MTVIKFHWHDRITDLDQNNAVKYVKKLALDTPYAIFFWNTYEYVKFPVI